MKSSQRVVAGLVDGPDAWDRVALPGITRFVESHDLAALDPRLKGLSQLLFREDDPGTVRACLESLLTSTAMERRYLAPAVLSQMVTSSEPLVRLLAAEAISDLLPQVPCALPAYFLGVQQERSPVVQSRARAMMYDRVKESSALEPHFGSLVHLQDRYYGPAAQYFPGARRADGVISSGQSDVSDHQLLRSLIMLGSDPERNIRQEIAQSLKHHDRSLTADQQYILVLSSVDFVSNYRSADPDILTSLMGLYQRRGAEAAVLSPLMRRIHEDELVAPRLRATAAVTDVYLCPDCPELIDIAFARIVDYQHSRHISYEAHRQHWGDVFYRFHDHLNQLVGRSQEILTEDGMIDLLALEQAEQSTVRTLGEDLPFGSSLEFFQMVRDHSLGSLVSRLTVSPRQLAVEGREALWQGSIEIADNAENRNYFRKAAAHFTPYIRPQHWHQMKQFLAVLDTGASLDLKEKIVWAAGEMTPDGIDKVLLQDELSRRFHEEKNPLLRMRLRAAGSKLAFPQARYPGQFEVFRDEEGVLIPEALDILRLREPIE